MGLLLLGNMCQAVNLAHFIRTPRGKSSFPMPYMTSPEGIGMVDFSDVDGSRRCGRI